MADKALFDSYGVTLHLPDGDVVLNSGAYMTILPSNNLITFAVQLPANLVYNARTAYQPPSSTDAKAVKNSIYYSTDGNKLSYKDPAGVVHALY